MFRLLADPPHPSREHRAIVAEAPGRDKPRLRRPRRLGIGRGSALGARAAQLPQPGLDAVASQVVPHLRLVELPVAGRLRVDDLDEVPRFLALYRTDPLADRLRLTPEPTCRSIAARPGRIRMDDQVFISYSTRDEPAAQAIYKGLKAEGISCWKAPEDIVPGTAYPQAIERAIAASDVLLLLFTEHANRSKDVQREVQRAAHHRNAIVCFRLRDVELSDDLAYFLGSEQWYAAPQGTPKSHVPRLAATLRRVLDEKSPDEDVPHPAPPRLPLLLKLGAVLLVMAGLAIGYTLMNPGDGAEGRQQADSTREPLGDDDDEGKDGPGRSDGDEETRYAAPPPPSLDELVKTGKLDKLKTRLKDVQERASDGTKRPLLHVAIETAQREVFEWLPEHGALATPQAARLALDSWVEDRADQDRFAMLRDLLEDVQLDDAGWTAVLEHPRAVVQLAGGSNLVHEAASSGDLERLQRFLAVPEAATTADSKGNTPLHHAIGSAACVELLLGAGAVIQENGAGQTAFELAEFQPDVQALLARPALEFAVQKDDPELAREAAGSWAGGGAVSGLQDAILRVVDEGKSVGLFRAIAQELERRGATFPVQRGTEDTLLHLAAHEDAAEILRLLLEKTAPDVAAENAKFEWPYEIARGDAKEQLALPTLEAALELGDAKRLLRVLEDEPGWMTSGLDAFDGDPPLLAALRMGKMQCFHEILGNMLPRQIGELRSAQEENVLHVAASVDRSSWIDAIVEDPAHHATRAVLEELGVEQDAREKTPLDVVGAGGETERRLVRLWSGSLRNELFRPVGSYDVALPGTGPRATATFTGSRVSFSFSGGDPWSGSFHVDAAKRTLRIPIPRERLGLEPGSEEPSGEIVLEHRRDLNEALDRLDAFLWDVVPPLRFRATSR